MLKELKLLNKLSDLIPKSNILEDWTCIYVQHLLESNIACIKFLESMGLKKESLYILGKGYSSNVDVYQYLINHGYNVTDPIDNYKYNYFFDKSIELRIINLINKNKKKFKKIIVLDEGGYAMKAISSIENKMKYKFKFVELTSRGAKYYNKIFNDFPIIDVAHSKVKKEIESKIIAESMIDNMIRLLLEKKINYKKMKCGLIGYGEIGKQLYKFLKKIFSSISIYDNQTFVTDLPKLLNDSDIILSSTGNGTVFENHYDALFGKKYFINCGSSDVEFNLWKIKKDKKFDSFNIENKQKPWKGDVVIQDKLKTLIFLRGGFPINFDGTKDPISPNVIQLTRTLMMSGAIQAINTELPGVHELSKTVQDYIIEKFNDLNQEKKMNCDFCKELSNNSMYIDNNFGSRFIINYKDIYVFPSLGELERGHLIIVPKEHVLSFSKLSELRKMDMKKLIEVIIRKYIELYNQHPIFFEHGNFDYGESGGQSIEHAHLHILPRSIDLSDKIRKYLEHVQTIPEISFSFSQEQSYILFIDSLENSHYFTGNIQSQLLRKLYAECIGKKKDWDWRENIDIIETLKSAEYFKQIFKGVLIEN